MPWSMKPRLGISSMAARKKKLKDQHSLNKDHFFSRLREPKKKGPVLYTEGAEERIANRLRLLGLTVRDYYIDVQDYRRYFTAARYVEDFPNYYDFNLPEKSLEHYIAAQLLQLNEQDVYIDIASEHSPVPKIYNSLYGTTTYRQDLSYPPGLNGDMIGGNAANLPVADEFATKMALHCSLEHFEGDSDIRFIRGSARVLKPGGAVCIVPLYLFEDYAIQTDPAVALSADVVFEDDAVVYCAEGWGNRHGRFYDPEHLFSRLGESLGELRMEIFRIMNFQEVHESCYVRFVLLIRKPEAF